METLESLASNGAIVRGDKSYAVQLAQTLLNQAGSCLTPDGVFGNATETAVRAFQIRSHITVSGRIGTTTARALDALGAPITQPEHVITSVRADAPWLTTMRAITGHREYPGAEDSPFVLAMAAAIAERYPEMAGYCRQYTHDTIPWCGLTIAYCLAENDIKPVFGDTDVERFLWAGAHVKAGFECEPCVGAIGVFTRKGGGHVSIIEGITKTHYIIRGGNQSDMINVSSMLKEKLTVAVWPYGWPLMASLSGQTANLIAAGSVA